MRKLHHIITVVTLLVVALPVVGIAAVPGALAAQVESSLEIKLSATYLAPEVVLSGSAASAAGIPEVVVVVTSDPDGEVLFDGIATTALRPPLGIPAASWRVPLTLTPGNYLVSATSTLDGELLDEANGQFEVVADLQPPLELIEIGRNLVLLRRG